MVYQSFAAYSYNYLHPQLLYMEGIINCRLFLCIGQLPPFTRLGGIHAGNVLEAKMSVRYLEPLSIQQYYYISNHESSPGSSNGLSGNWIRLHEKFPALRSDS